MLKNKKVVAGLAALVVVAALGLAFASSGLEKFVKKAVESYGGAATQTAVTLGGFNISLKNGEGSLRNLSVGNPAGFSDGDALSLGAISIKVDTATLTGTGPIVISEMLIDKPRIAYEISAAGTSNLDTIARNARKYAGNGLASAKSSSSSGRKVTIEKLTITDGEVSISGPMIVGQKNVKAALPVINVRNIGKNGGASPAEIAQTLIGTMSSGAIQAAAATSAQGMESLKALTGGAKKAAGDVGDAAKNIFNR